MNFGIAARSIGSVMRRVIGGGVVKRRTASLAADAMSGYSVNGSRSAGSGAGGRVSGGSGMRATYSLRRSPTSNHERH